MKTNLEIKPMMTDIHMHLIPGVDDGDWNLDMSMKMVRMAYEQGVRKIIATPHSSAFEYGLELAKENYVVLREKVQEYYSNMSILLGCEVYCSRYEMKEVLQYLADGVIPSLNGTKYVLTEFGSRVDVEEAYFCVTELLENGWIPVIAHVERYPKLFAEEGFLENLKQMGCLFQINVYSVYEEANEGIKENACALIKKQMVDFLGTDAHRTFHRPPKVKSGLQFLYENFEREYIDAIAFENAEKCLC